MPAEIDGPRLEPRGAEAKRLVVFLHGYGADGNDLIEIGRAWIERRPVGIARPARVRFPVCDEPRDLGASFEARKGQFARLQPHQRESVVIEVLGLPPHRPLPFDAEPREVLVNRRLELRPAARRVDVLDAQQEPPARGVRHLEIDQRGKRMTEMQIAVRAWREAENRGRHAFAFGLAGA